MHQIHDLNPMGGGTGKARTDLLMDHCEENHTQFSLFGAGYEKKIEEMFFASNPGIKGSFPYTWRFSDYNEAELRTIFLDMVRNDQWEIAPIPGSDIDVATVSR